MNKTKRGYEAPTSELLVVRFEQNIMSAQNSWDGPATQNSVWADLDIDNGME